VDEALLKVVNAIPQQAQRQYSLTEQLQVLWKAANKLGLYDAADYVSDSVFVAQRRERREKAAKK
jgi:hypothetical protein